MPELIAPALEAHVDSAAVELFQQNGFHIERQCIFADLSAVQRFRSRLEAVLNGEGDTGRPVYKMNKIPASLKVNGRFVFTERSSTSSKAPTVSKRTSDIDAKQRHSVPTIHAINAWYADSLLRDLVMSPAIGRVVARLMHWEAFGCRVAQDQVWIKPPHSGSLTYHRDTPYLDFHPKEVCTVWIPFDPVKTLEVGTLEYCAGSHRWGSERRGSAKHFYNADYKALLRTAAEREALQRSAKCAGTQSPVPVEADPEAVEELLRCVVPVLGEAGCCSFHNGNTWHGSCANVTDGWRCGIGIHYIRGDAVFAEETGKLWNDLRQSPTSRELPEGNFPLVVPPISDTTSLMGNSSEDFHLVQ